MIDFPGSPPPQRA